MKHKYLFWLTVLLVVFLIGWWFWAAGTPKGQPPLKYITENNLGQFRSDFDAAVHEERLVLLLSPS